MNQEQLKALIAKHTPKPKRKADGGLVPKLIKRGAELGMKLWRNQVGTYKLSDGRYISSGLCVGSSDLIGYLPVVITPEMVGRTVAVFVAAEAKADDGVVTERQYAFLNGVHNDGGIATVARSIAALDNLFDLWRA